MSEQSIEIKTADGTMDVWSFHPDGPGPWPAVILHTDVRGVRQAFKDMAKQLARQGFFVLLPNLYYRVARPPLIDPALAQRSEGEQARLNVLRQGISIDGLHRDHAALLDYLTVESAAAGHAVGIVGYCMSGSIALRAAADFPQRIVAAASFHGGRLASTEPDSPHLRATDIRAKLYMGYAQDDASMTDEMIARLEQALSAAQVDFSSERYSARHGFAVLDSQAFNAAAADQHWRALATLFGATLAGRA